MASDTPALVVDCGSSSCKVGFAGEDEPTSVFPCVVGRPRKDTATLQKSVYIGQDAISKRQELDLALKYPIEFSYVCDWENMQIVLDHIFNVELSASPEEQPILLTEPPMNPKSNREKMTQIMFESYNTSAMYLAMQPVLALYATGMCDTGLVLHCGDGFMFTVPVYEGYALPHATHKLPVAGRELTQHMSNLLNKKDGRSFTYTDWEIVRDIKEKACYVSLDYEQELTKTAIEPVDYKLPDGTTLSLTSERFQCPEALFQPKIAEHEFPGVHELLFSSLTKCQDSFTSTLYENIIVSGGSTMFPGFTERLEAEVRKLAPTSTKVKVKGLPERLHSAWKGGSMLATSSGFSKMCITKDEYDERGPTMVHRKCF